MSDKRVGGLDVQKPDGNVAPVRPSALAKGLPEPFKSEPTGGAARACTTSSSSSTSTSRSARVYFGSYNFSAPADTTNGENLVLVRDRRIAVAYMVEALRLFDHYHFRVTQKEAKTAKTRLMLARPPRDHGEVPWWDEHYTIASKIRDRELFA